MKSSFNLKLSDFYAVFLYKRLYIFPKFVAGANSFQTVE